MTLQNEKKILLLHWFIDLLFSLAYKFANFHVFHTCFFLLVLDIIRRNRDRFVGGVVSLLVVVVFFSLATRQVPVLSGMSKSRLLIGHYLSPREMDV